MAKALECPACGAKHRLDGLEASTTFRCEQCGQTLKVPASIATVRADPAPTPTTATASREHEHERYRHGSAATAATTVGFAARPRSGRWERDHRRIR